jgi:hypothetical protein
MATLVIALHVSPAAAERVVRTIDWRELEQPGLLRDRGVVEADEEAGFDCVRIPNPQPGASTILLLKIENPGVAGPVYGIRGMVRTEKVQGEAYLELQSRFPDGKEFFSKTLERQGPMRNLIGTSDWRFFALPFQAGESRAAGPAALELSLMLPGVGTVYLGPLELVQFQAGDDFLADPRLWWSGGTSGLAGGLLGVLIGCVGAWVGAMAAKGRSYGLVMKVLIATVCLGVVLVAVAGFAMSADQPFDVYWPFLLSGGLCVVLPLVLLLVVRRRYQTLVMLSRPARGITSVDSDDHTIAGRRIVH